MGLDMYLTARNYLFSLDDADKRAKEAITKAVEDALGIEITALDSDSFNPGVIGVEISAAYWRKANAIHKWFVDNYQDGVDDCREAYVSRDGLQELVDMCESIVAGDGKHTPEDLAPRGGFFFGSTDIDEYYFEDLRNTVRQLKAALTLPDSFEFYYRSSW